MISRLIDRITGYFSSEFRGERISFYHIDYHAKYPARERDELIIFIIKTSRGTYFKIYKYIPSNVIK